MVQLPDWTSLGSAPSGNSGRPISSTKDFSGEASRNILANASAASDFRGLQHLGAGLEKVGEAAIKIGVDEKEATDRLDFAKAQADLSGHLLGLKEQLSTDADQNALRSQYRDKGLGVLNTVAQNIGDPGLREMFIAKNQDQIDNLALSANQRANTLYGEQYRAGLVQTRDGLMKAFIASKDNSERALYLKQWNDFLGAATQAGVIDADRAAKDMDAFTQGAAKNYILAQPPAERLAILGGVRPGEIAAKDLSPSDAALLNAIAGPESAGKYNVRYGGTFSDFSQHPNIAQTITEGPNKGKTSSAAGRYQFIKGTWDMAAKALGLSDFSPENQDKAALWLAKKTYLEKTGRALDDDIQKNGGLTADMLDVLSTKKGGQWEGFDSDKGKAKALAAYRATVGNKVDMASAFALITDPHAAVLDPEDQRQLLHGAVRDYNLETQQRYLDRKNAEASVNQKLGDDWASVTETGKPIDSVTPEEVGRVFGPQRRQQFERDRQIGMDYWAATHDLDQLSDGEIRQRLDMIDPRNHEGEGAKTWEKLYKSAAGKAKEIITLRAKDPAAAADRLPDVAAVKQQVDLGGDVNAQRDLIKARMKAFEVMGVPPDRQVPVTRQEAKDLMAPVEQSLPGQEKEALAAIVTKINNIYGDAMTDRVLGFALESAKVDQDTSKVAARVFKQLGLGQKPAAEDIDALNQTQTNSAMAAVAAPKPSSAMPDFGGQSSPDAWAAGQEKAAAAAKKYPFPSDSDMRLLIQQPTPTRIQQFDTIYGPGASKRVMGAATQQNGGNS